MIGLTIKTLDSQNHKFRVPDTFTVLELKEHIAGQVKVAVIQQRLIFCGRVLSNETKLADIGIDGKVMHLVQKIPRLATTMSGSSTSTTTNTNSRSGQNGSQGFRGWHTHGHDPTVLLGAIGIPTELMHAGELPRFMSGRNNGTTNRLSVASDMIRKSNEILNRLDNPGNAARPSTSDVEQFPEASHQAENTSENIPPESSAPSVQSDPDSVNVSYEVDETFPNTVVVTIDATHHMRMNPELMHQMHNRLQGNNPLAQNSTEQNVSETAIPVRNNQSPVEQASSTLPSASSEQNPRNDHQTPESRASAAINDRRRLKELFVQIDQLNARLLPYYNLYCQYVNDDPQFESTEGDAILNRTQTVFNSVSEVMHYLSHVYHAISDIRVAFNRPPPRVLQSRPCVIQGTIFHTAHSVTTNLTAPPPQSSQQPTSTQTTTTSQSIPSEIIQLDFVNPGVRSEINLDPILSAGTNPSLTIVANSGSNNTNSEFPSEGPHSEDPNGGVELTFDLTPGSIRIDSTFISPNTNTPGSSQPTVVSQPSSETDPTSTAMPIDWMDQMIDVISSGVRRPFMSDQSLDWSSIPTTSTRTPRVTPRTTDSSSNATPVPLGIALNRGRWDATSPRMDPFLPCSSHHFETNSRPTVLARRSTLGTDRSTSSANSGNSTTDTSTPTSPNEMRPFSVRRPGRPRTRYLHDSDGLLAGIHPILSWGRNHRPGNINIATPNQQSTAALPAESLTGQIIGLGSVFDSLDREEEIERARDIHLQASSSSSFENILAAASYVPPYSTRQPDELLLTPIGNIPYFRNLEGRFILMDLFLLIARNWTLHDILNLNIRNINSSISRNSINSNSQAILNFIMNRVMRNQPINTETIDEAANRLYLEIAAYLTVFQVSVPRHTHINVNASFLRCITRNLHTFVRYCEENRAQASIDIATPLRVFVEALIMLIVYCCNSRAVFRLSVGSIMQLTPFPTNMHRIIMDEVRLNIDRYWNCMATYSVLSLSVVEYIVPLIARDAEVGQTSRVGNAEQSSIPILPSPEIVNEPLPEVVIGSQEWHHSVPSEWVPVIARDSQRQRRQGTQPPYSDAYLSSMPNKRRKIVTSAKPQGPLSQIITKSLEVAMGTAGVTINKEVTESIGADTEVQSAYTERIRTFGRIGLDTHPDFCPDRYPNASKFFYGHNNPN